MATPSGLSIDVGQYTSPILSLPYFVGQLLFEHLDGDLACLKALALTCRCFHSFARPLIFRRIEFHSPPNMRMGHDALQENHRKRVRALARNPNGVLQWIRHVVLSVDEAEQATYYPFPEDIQADLARCLQEIPLLSSLGLYSLALEGFLINEILQLLERGKCAVVLHNTGFINPPIHQRSTRLLVTSISITEGFARIRPYDQPAFLCHLLERSSEFLTSLSVNGLQSRLLLLLCEVELPNLVKFTIIGSGQLREAGRTRLDNRLVAFLVHCSSIRELDLIGRFNVTALPTTSLPRLQRLGCSSRLLVTFLPYRLLSNLNVSLDQPVRWLSRNDYIQAIDQPLPSITSLELTSCVGEELWGVQGKVDLSDGEWSNGVLQWFPNLTSLRLLLHQLDVADLPWGSRDCHEVCRSVCMLEIQSLTLHSDQPLIRILTDSWPNLRGLRDLRSFKLFIVGYTTNFTARQRQSWSPSLFLNLVQRLSGDSLREMHLEVESCAVYRVQREGDEDWKVAEWTVVGSPRE
jgi:hypothetical protein